MDLYDDYYPVMNYRNTFLYKVVLFLTKPYFVVMSLVVFVVLITAVSLAYSTKQVTKGYLMNSLDVTHQNLVKEKNIKEMAISEVRSLKYIQNTPKVMSMQNPNMIVYVSGKDTAIASR